MLNRVVCKAVTETGDEVLCSVKAADKDLTAADIEKLKKECSKKFSGIVEDTLYYTIRATINVKKDNWKCKTLGQLYETLERVL